MHLTALELLRAGPRVSAEGSGLSLRSLFPEAWASAPQLHPRSLGFSFSMGPGDSGNPSRSKEPAPFALVGRLFREGRGQPPRPPSGRPRPAFLDPQPRTQLNQEQGRQRHSLGETASVHAWG